MPAMVTVDSLTAIITTYLPEPHAGLLSGISFGAKAAMSKSLTEALITTGTLHIVALSGMNISIVSGLVSSLLLRFVSRRITSLLTVLIIMGFVWFVGLSASVVRAAVMGIISLLAIILGRSNWPFLTWAVAVTFMLILNFSWLSDLSFQLSSLATLGIILFGRNKNQAADALRGITFFALRRDAPQGKRVTDVYPEPSEGLEKERRAASSLACKNFSSSPQRLPLSAFIHNIFALVRHFFADDLRVTLAAQVFTIPVIFLNFHRVSLISPLSNIFIGWTIGPLMILGWFAGILGLLFDPLGQVLAWFAWVPLQFVLWVIMTASRFPFASLSF